jgi:hypothetical protein
MIAIEIRVNGKLEATCGDDGLRQLVAMVAARRRTADAEFKYVVECMGVRPKNSSTEEVLRWVNTRLALGDEVSFKVIEVAEAQAPFDRQDIAAGNAQAS